MDVFVDEVDAAAWIGETMVMTVEDIEDGFDFIAEEAAGLGLVAEIAVYGGSCIMLASDLRQATGDVDAVFLANAEFLYDSASRAVRRLGLPDDWLNQAVISVAPPPGGAKPNLLPFGEYPRHRRTGVGLRVHTPTPEYMLAMKLLANRLEDDFAKIQTDRADIQWLMRITGISDHAGLVALMTQCYPRLPGLTEAGISPRLDAKLRTVLDDYEEQPDAPVPPLRAGRGPATIDG